MKSETIIRNSIRNWTLLFMVLLIFSGVTAFALETELGWLDRIFLNKTSGLAVWIYTVYMALRQTNQSYPFLSYGYDWLALLPKN